MNGSSKALINLLRGWPNASLLPVNQIKAASSIALSDPSIYTPALLYGPDQGYEPLRHQIAQWLTRFYQTPRAIDPERICITGGASQNLACLLQEYSDPLYTRNVWMVSPTYFLACRIFEDSGFHGRLRSVPEDGEGVDIDFLSQEIHKSEQKARAEGNLRPTLKPPRPWGKIYRHLIYAVPTFANPSSKTMTFRRRQQLVKLAREYDALIITDDVYDQLQWAATESSTNSGLEHAVLPRIVDVDRELDDGPERLGADGFGNAVSNGSFSKIVGPGCRSGWAEGAKKLSYGLSQVGSSRSGGAPSQLTATFMSTLIESGDLQRHIFQTLQPAYARRYSMMVDAVEKDLLPLSVTFPNMDRDVMGGYFIWIALPEPLQAEEVALRARQEENLIIAPGTMFGVSGDDQGPDLKRKVRLCFSWEEENLLSEGVERLGKVIFRLQDTQRYGQGVAQPPPQKDFDAEDFR